MSSRRVTVIGAGFSGLAAASHLAKSGFEVQLLEQHDQAGGRARSFDAEGFRFDMGPSWYWMPDIFDRYFAAFGKTVEQLYDLRRLDPSYRVIWSGEDLWDIPAGVEALRELFESRCPGAGEPLDRFLAQTRYIYESAVEDYLLRPSLSIFEFVDPRLVFELGKMRMLRSMHAYAKSFFDDPRLVRLVEWPVLFLGASAKKTSAMYSLMAYADMALGTWYPMGGMHRIIEGMVEVALEQGVDLRLSRRVESVVTKQGRVVGVQTEREMVECDAVVAAADYHHVEQNLLERDDRQFRETQWARKTMSPSSLLFYLGVRGKVDGLRHHTLFFDRDLDAHMSDVYERPAWPKEPLFYVCCPSKTDPSVAPAEDENLFVLVPLAPGLQDSDEEREKIFELVLRRIEEVAGSSIRERIVYRRHYAMRDFERDYGAYKGNAYGMANTLSQTGPFKPPLRSRKVDNLYFAGQLTVPGPGMPPSLISGELSAKVLTEDLGAASPS
ncbi:MAG: phytoene desaturase family protein [Nannocystaceae bacterium]|nr:phytoene desaturase family protein [bacterium]